MGILIIRKGSHEGRKFPIRPGSSLTFGREGVDIAFQDPGMSRRHCLVESREDGDYLQDLRSTNGTMVNGRKIAEVKLAPGDEICVGFTIIDYVDTDSSSPEDTSGTLVVPSAGVRVSSQPTAVFSVGDIEAAVESDMAAAKRATPPRGQGAASEAEGAGKSEDAQTEADVQGTQSRATVDAAAAALRERLQAADQAKNYAEQESQVFRKKLDEASSAISAIRSGAEELRGQLDTAELARQDAERESSVLRQKYQLSSSGADNPCPDADELRIGLQEAEFAAAAAERERDEFRLKWEKAHAEHEQTRLEVEHLRERLKSTEAECRRLKEQGETPEEGSGAARYESEIEKLRDELKRAQQEAHQVKTRFSLREQLVGQLLREAEQYQKLEAEHKHLVEEHRNIFGELEKHRTAAAKVGDLSGELSRAKEEANSAQTRMRALEEQIKAVDRARHQADLDREQLITKVEEMQATQANNPGSGQMGLALAGAEELQGIKQRVESIASETRQMHLWMMLKEMLGNKAGGVAPTSSTVVPDDLIDGLGRKMAQTYGNLGAVIPGKAHVVEQTTMPNRPPTPPPPRKAPPPPPPSPGIPAEERTSSPSQRDWLFDDVDRNDPKDGGTKDNEQDNSEPEETGGPSWL